MNSSMQIVDPLFKLHRVVRPRFTIDSRRSSLLQFQEAGAQEFWRDGVQYTRELSFLILLCRVTYT